MPERPSAYSDDRIGRSAIRAIFLDFLEAFLGVGLHPRQSIAGGLILLGLAEILGLRPQVGFLLRHLLTLVLIWLPSLGRALVGHGIGCSKCHCIHPPELIFATGARPQHACSAPSAHR